MSAVKIEWRTCGACNDIFNGPFGGCPKCKEASAKKQPYFGGSIGGKRGKPTLDIQEGNADL